ncbi:hypothetical protein [Aequorivita flava]|uniref:Uncharacterized protein n=1 Tax=Aequorivita flava TaxID=3114371 RepID=A0AB35YZY9_9FLAO
MALKTIISDDSNNEMECYLNDSGKVYIEVGQNSEDTMYSGHIVLEKEDVQFLIKKLTELETQMQN